MCGVTFYSLMFLLHSMVDYLVLQWPGPGYVLMYPLGKLNFEQLHHFFLYISLNELLNLGHFQFLRSTVHN